MKNAFPALKNDHRAMTTYANIVWGLGEKVFKKSCRTLYRYNASHYITFRSVTLPYLTLRYVTLHDVVVRRHRTIGCGKKSWGELLKNITHCNWGKAAVNVRTWSWGRAFLKHGKLHSINEKSLKFIERLTQ